MSAGLYTDWSEINRFLTDYTVYKPDPEAVKVYDKAYAVYRDLYTQLQPSCQNLHTLYENT